ncbi:MarR family transcriptional regulator [Georgenia sp. 10Sc9-8]|uniref:MarR family transcriptional regulator n=1 Tax=Georgenia halotolerans TaxID=3028317 RepID=A0ABT5TVP7_9MICO|nr:MarR family transcriptional regulator [Georgenia halotolerans]
MSAGMQEPRWLDAEQQRAWREFLRGSARVLDAIDHDLEAETGLSLNEYEVMVRLSEVPGRTMRMSVLADNLVHSRSRLTHTVRRMEETGLVVRESCPDDRRGVNCRLTDAGFERLRSIAPGHVASVRRHLVDRLGPERMQQLGAIMALLTDDEEDEADAAAHGRTRSTAPR